MDQNFQEFCGFVTELLKPYNKNLEVKPGKKYFKLVSRDTNGSGGSVWAFVDKTTGEIFKPASYAAPAKHARGNVQDPKTYQNYPWTGPFYLR